ncbi:MAG: hypothetical protein ACE5D7_01925 [Fidelibacterota bacterium]
MNRSGQIVFFLFLFTVNFAQESYVDSTKIKDPKLAWRLGFIPGAGQIYNEKYLKAFSFIALQGYATHQFIKFKKDDRIKKRNTYGWWIFGLYVLGILDAYVDAQLSTFPVKILPPESGEDDEPNLLPAESDESNP